MAEEAGMGGEEVAMAAAMAVAMAAAMAAVWAEMAGLRAYGRYDLRFKLQQADDQGPSSILMTDRQHAGT